MRAIVWTKRLTIAFCALALTALLIGVVLFFVYPQDAFSHPVELQKDFSFQRQFRVSSNAIYRIEVRFPRLLPFEQMNELLKQSNLVKIELLKDRGPTELRYFPGAITTALPASLGATQEWISQDIATFRGDPKSIYTITCFVVRPLEELDRTHPILFVTLDPLEVKEAWVVNLLLAAVFVICALLALVFGGCFLGLRRHVRHTLTTDANRIRD
ncbi:MAG: hypothetical protein QOG67_1400 [Verrucomicrobiota bacterium]